MDRLRVSGRAWRAVRHGSEILRRAWSGGAGLLLPEHCAYCGISRLERITTSGIDIRFCQRCQAAFETPDLSCKRCAAPLPRLNVHRESCPRCQNRAYRFHAAVAGGFYRGQLQEAVLRLKVGHSEALGVALGEWLAGRWESVRGGQRPDVIVPIPCHWRRRWTRGCNPAEVLAQRIATILRVPLRTRILRVRRRTRKQGTLTPNQRFENVRGLFNVSAGYVLAGRSVLLVDDVMTTGATASEAARTLRRAGAGHVEVLVVARGIGN